MKQVKDLLRNDTYLSVNISLLGVIILIMAYSLLFSPEKNNYPVACMHEVLTGEECVSCGLSHSFSLILRGRIDEANEWNSNGMRIFLFFVSQIFLRIIFSVSSVACPHLRKKIQLADIFISLLFFIFSFYPFIRFIFISAVSAQR
jgi:uncharacterized membrane protein